jgi:hypothetical protein
MPDPELVLTGTRDSQVPIGSLQTRNVQEKWHGTRSLPLARLTLANVKGGVGKSTLCSALTVRAAEESKRASISTHRRASWWTRCGKTKNLKLREVSAATEAIELPISEGWEWAFVEGQV